MIRFPSPSEPWGRVIGPAWVVAAIALAGCSSKPPADPLVGAADAGTPIVVGTLATNPCEVATAPTYTDAIVETRRASLQFRRGQLSEDRAREALQFGRSAQTELDAACRDGVLDSNRLAAAQEAVSKMQDITGGAR